jgi:hypothetical protein
VAALHQHNAAIGALEHFRRWRLNLPVYKNRLQMHRQDLELSTLLLLLPALPYQEITSMIENCEDARWRNPQLRGMLDAVYGHHLVSNVYSTIRRISEIIAGLTRLFGIGKPGSWSAGTCRSTQQTCGQG